MSPTLVDIARETKTSVSTVSRVLSGGAMANRISKATRDRVKEAATRLGYRPNLLARSLRTRKTHTIGLIVSDIANPFYGYIGSLIERSLAKAGYSLMLCNSAEDANREADYLRLVTQRGIDGLILVPLLKQKKNLQTMVPSGLPLVLLDRPITGVDASVATDQEQAATVLCDTLAKAGVRKVAVIAGPEYVSTHRRRAEIFAQRFDLVAPVHHGPAHKETGRAAFREMLPRLSEAQAICCTNNFLAQGVIDSVAQIDLKSKPPIVAVFDEIPMMDLLPIPIVCSIQDVTQLAETTVAQLLTLLEDPAAKLEPVMIPAKPLSNRAFQVISFAPQQVAQAATA
ncbi:MAG TPA: LacI family DNA-binding transcriptional regulator [Tepidisphaeraceae bacterium]|nr:LacI family DNA-binding transcriptional regulator [Tepidisphaeraceae bacterium]